MRPRIRTRFPPAVSLPKPRPVGVPVLYGVRTGPPGPEPAHPPSFRPMSSRLRPDWQGERKRGNHCHPVQEMLSRQGAEIALVPICCDLAAHPACGEVRIAQARGRAFETVIGIAIANCLAALRRS